MSKLIQMNVRLEVGGRTFSISASDGKTNYRDLTESTTGRYVTEKQSAMLGKLAGVIESAVGKLALPAEPAAKAAKPAKGAKVAAKAAPKGRAKKG